MGSGETIPFPGGSARVVSLAELRETDAWTAAFRDQAKDSRFYGIVEETITGFEHHYLILQDNNGRVRGVQPFFFLQQNLVEGVPALRSIVDFIRRTFPRFLTMRVLMIGCAAGEGHLGICESGDEDWFAIALYAALNIYARGKAALIVFKDFSARYRDMLQRFADNGYTRIPSMPMTQLALSFRDFDDYFGRLSKATRKDLRRKFKRVEKASPIQLEVVTDVSPWVDEMYPLYLQVQERSPLKFETLTKDYFRELGRCMPDKVRFFIWRQEGKIVAFSLCLVHRGVIYDDYLGLDYSVALDLHLYFVTFCDILGWAVAQGLSYYRSSPLNYEPKLHLDCELAPLDLYVRHTNPWLNRIFPPILKLLEPTRHDPVLQRFPNARELRR
ncbi:MAG: GNAT family N-acetyltransferase [Chthoniobacterales bacterium]